MNKIKFRARRLVVTEITSAIFFPQCDR